MNKQEYIFFLTDLSVEKEFAEKYEIPYIGNIARWATRSGLHETSSGKCWSVVVCRFCRQVLNILLLPLRLLGMLIPNQHFENF